MGIEESASSETRSVADRTSLTKVSSVEKLVS